MHTRSSTTGRHSIATGLRPWLAGYLLLAGLAAALPACLASGDDVASLTPGRVIARHQQAFSSTGIERLIPLRFVELLAAGQTQNLSHANLLRAVERANRTWHAAGIAFTVKQHEAYTMPHLLGPRYDATAYSWGDVRDELRQIYPGLSEKAFQAGTLKTTAWWLRAAELLAGDPSHIVVFLTTEGGSLSTFPWDGPAVMFQQTNISSGEVVAFPHEIGHILGLVHPQDVGSWWARDPEDPSRALPKWKSWDLVYRPGYWLRAHRLFHSRADAQPYESDLEPIYRGSNCSVIGSGPDVTCYLGFALGADSVVNPPGFFFQIDASTAGYNIMGGPTPPGALDKPPSDSQVEVAREYLRFDIPLWSSSLSAMTDGMTVLPAETSGRRPYLGIAQPRDPALALDFDGDGRRDLAVWDAPATASFGSGTFRIRLSTTGLIHTVSFGVHGVIPVPADYNGDGIADLAVYEPGTSYANNLSTWRICDGMDCSNPTNIQFGSRSNIPLPGHDMVGDQGADLMVWDDINRKFHWRSLTSATKYYRYMGTGNLLVPVVARLSNGPRPDLAVYDMHSAILTWFDSHDGVKRQQSFSADFIPADTGSLAQRAAVVPIVGMKFSATWDRLAFWLPGEGRWTLLSPSFNKYGAVASFSTQTCKFGAQTTDLPVPGIDMSGDGVSDLLIWRPTADNTNAQLHWRPSWCGPGQVQHYASPRRSRVHVVPVADMSSPPDGKPDLLVLEADDGAFFIRVLDSKTGFTTWIVNDSTLGTARSVVL